jgi:hypothetical protein
MDKRSLLQLVVVVRRLHLHLQQLVIMELLLFLGRFLRLAVAVVE